jgi:hypothetical protein
LWEGSGIPSALAMNYKGKVEAKVIEDILGQLSSGESLPDEIIPYLKYTLSANTSDNICPILVSSGPHDNRKTIKNLVSGEQYIIMIKPTEDFVDDIHKTHIEIANYNFNIDTGFYDKAGGKVFLTFNTDDWTYCDGNSK